MLPSETISSSYNVHVCVCVGEIEAPKIVAAAAYGQR